MAPESYETLRKSHSFGNRNTLPLKTQLSKTEPSSTNLQRSSSDPGKSTRKSAPHTPRQATRTHTKQSRHGIKGDHINVHTECGRHSDDWLFGGLSLSDIARWLFGKGRRAETEGDSEE
ncbi:hypothetical protein BDZ45DRAFT_292243 [Acephala macrosclerotiorum]|nr:hypothetical protein BDZ45DRAFT_292243 [Acephala macrosclerotiorum]